MSHPGSRWPRCGRSPRPAAQEHPAAETLPPPERRRTPFSYTPLLSTEREDIRWTIKNKSCRFPYCKTGAHVDEIGKWTEAELPQHIVWTIDPCRYKCCFHSYISIHRNTKQESSWLQTEPLRVSCSNESLNSTYILKSQLLHFLLTSQRIVGHLARLCLHRVTNGGTEAHLVESLIFPWLCHYKT